MLGLLLAGCHHQRAVDAASAPGPCEDLHGCEVGCGEGRDADCVALRGRLGEVDPDERDTPRAVAETGCVAGAIGGCALAGDLWLAADRRVASGWFERACVRSDPHSCARFAMLLGDGSAGRDDPARATALGVWSCERGEAIGCRVAGLGAADPIEADRRLQQACDQKDAPACHALAARLEDPDEARSRALYDRACALGDADACRARDALDDRVHPLEQVVVRVFAVGYATEWAARTSRTPTEAEALAHQALDQLARGVPLERVAEAYGDHPTDGEVLREQRLIRVRTPSPLQDAAFTLTPGASTCVEVPSFGWLVVTRP
jgi:hypothetical protein